MQNIVQKADDAENNLTENRIYSFPPVADANSRILILGSMPGVKSLDKQQYYGHPQNAFWKIMFRLLKVDPTEVYDEKIDLLKKNHIALWDVIDSCEREGSLDSAIKNEQANKVEELLETHPNIRAIFCNGQKSYKNLQKILGKNFSTPIYALPSTSPLHTISLETKIDDWRVILDYLNPD
mgnify:CR=1 FL=1